MSRIVRGVDGPETVDDLGIHRHKPARHGAGVRHVWITTPRLYSMYGRPVPAGDFTCSGCGRLSSPASTWNTVKLDRNDRIATGTAVYAYCVGCQINEDPAHAWAHAEVAWRNMRNLPSNQVTSEQP